MIKFKKKSSTYIEIWPKKIGFSSWGLFPYLRPMVILYNDARSKLASGIKQMASAVKSTLGPGGNTVVIDAGPEMRFVGGFTITKDGVTVARSIKLDDPVENLAVRIMRQVSELSASRAGDGTTTAVVLAEALISAGGGLSLSETRELQRLAASAVKILRCRARPLVTSDGLLSIATISANGDAEMGALIADAYEHVGKGGIVVAEKGQGTTCTLDKRRGVRFQRGYASRVFVNDQSNDSVVFDNALLLVIDGPVNNILHIETIIRGVIASGDPLVIIGDVSDQVVMTLAANVVKNGMRFAVVAPPSFGWRRQELMEDLALVTGGRLFSERTGDDLSIATMADLGRVSRISITRDETTVTLGDGVPQEATAVRIAQVEKQGGENAADRLAMLRGLASVIQVGAHTDVEQKELYDRMEDSICAVRAAMDGGILPGGGVALRDVAAAMEAGFEDTPALRVLTKALREPMSVLYENAGVELPDVPSGHGMCLVTGAVGDMYALGVIDPALVTISALEGAVSVASTVLGSNAVVL
jgi:chaperonin GroEL